MTPASRTKRVGDVQVGEDAAFQRREWAVQRAGWGVMVLTALCAMLGLFGGRGLLSRGEVGGAGDPLRLEYPRLHRHSAPGELRFTIAPAVAERDSTVRLWLDADYLDAHTIRGVAPEPEAQEAGADRITYLFKLSDPTRPATVTFHLEPESTGMLRGRAGMEGRASLAFSQFVYP